MDQLRRANRILALALCASIALGTTAQAGTGGVGYGGSADTGEPVAPGCASTDLGKRKLALGDCGIDVRTLHWFLRAKDYAVPLIDDFEADTEAAVKGFQGTAALPTTGVVDRASTSAIIRGMPRQGATWYGTGMYGSQTACGETLARTTIGVAHKTLPCGSKVLVRYGGRYLRTTVIDRGPYTRGVSWDFTRAAAEQLGFEAQGRVRIRVAKLARRP
jgi:hypothetical protein